MAASLVPTQKKPPNIKQNPNPMSLTFRTPCFLLHLPNLTPLPKSPLKPLFLTSNLQTPNILCFCNLNNNNNNNIPNKINDSDLASDFAAEVHKLNTQLKDREAAMKTSKQLLFSDFCNYLDSNPDDVMFNWMNLSADEKLGLVQGFISDWGLNFHPLSPKSVRDLLEEFVVKDSQENQNPNLFQNHDDDTSNSNSNSNSAVILPTLKKLFMGFSPDN